MARTLLSIVGGAAIVVMSFFTTLYVLDFFDPAYVANQTRAADVKRLREAIDKYHKDRGSYPALPGNPVDDLGKDLVQGGYLKQIPSDPLRAAGVFQYQYASDGRTMYAILVRQAEENSLARSRPAGLCVAGVGAKGSGIWGHLPECWF
jgi:hypothetical protein